MPAMRLSRNPRIIPVPSIKEDKERRNRVNSQHDSRTDPLFAPGNRTQRHPGTHYQIIDKIQKIVHDSSLSY